MLWWLNMKAEYRVIMAVVIFGVVGALSGEWLITAVITGLMLAIGLYFQGKRDGRQQAPSGQSFATASHNPAPSPMALAAPTSVPAGWYSDPHNTSQVRWFDGQQWTANVQ